jgi:hypothetical protein
LVEKCEGNAGIADISKCLKTALSNFKIGKYEL